MIQVNKHGVSCLSGTCQVHGIISPGWLICILLLVTQACAPVDDGYTCEDVTWNFQPRMLKRVDHFSSLDSMYFISYVNNDIVDTVLLIRDSSQADFFVNEICQQRESRYERQTLFFRFNDNEKSRIELELVQEISTGSLFIFWEGFDLYSRNYFSFDGFTLIHGKDTFENCQSFDDILVRQNLEPRTDGLYNYGGSLSFKANSALAFVFVHDTFGFVKFILNRDGKQIEFRRLLKG